MKIIFVTLLMLLLCVSMVSAEKRITIENGPFYKEGKPFFPFGYVFGRTDEKKSQITKKTDFSQEIP